jgi:hypothetical protein
MCVSSEAAVGGLVQNEVLRIIISDSPGLPPNGFDGFDQTRDTLRD